HGFSCQHSVERIPQVGFCGGGTALVEIDDAIIDPPEVQNRSLMRQQGGLRRRCRSSQTHEHLFRIEEYRELKTKLRRVLPDRRFGERRIRLYRIKRD